MAALMVTLILAGAATAASLAATREAMRDRNVKTAIEAADSGLAVSLYRLNKFAASLTSSQPCVGANGSSGVLGPEAAQGNGWCRPQEEELGGGAAYSYQVSVPLRTSVAGQDVYQREVVSVGAVGTQRRRVSLTVNAPSGKALFADTVFSDEDLSMRNSSYIEGNARSNGNIITQNSSLICGNATIGPAKQFRGTGICSGFNVQEATEPWVLSPVVLPASNDNARIGDQDPWADPSSISWNPTTRVLALRNSSTLTLTGENYVFCGLTLDQSSRLITPPDGSPVRIYIDAPENCDGRTVSFGAYNSSTIQNDSDDPTMVQLYVAGSPFIPTSVELRNRTRLHMVIYSPNSTLTFDNFSQVVGAVAAKRVVIQNNLEIRWDPRVANLLLGDVPLPTYTAQAWVECAAEPTAAAPDSGC
jgi:hypothetical protein